MRDNLIDRKPRFVDAAKFIVGRNCRFLAGPATNPATSKRIRDSLNRGEGINTLVLNYSTRSAFLPISDLADDRSRHIERDGSPFWNLVSSSLVGLSLY